MVPRRRRISTRAHRRRLRPSSRTRATARWRVLHQAPPPDPPGGRGLEASRQLSPADPPLGALVLPDPRGVARSRARRGVERHLPPSRSFLDGSHGATREHHPRAEADDRRDDAGREGPRPLPQRDHVRAQLQILVVMSFMELVHPKDVRMQASLFLQQLCQAWFSSSQTWLMVS